MRQYHIALIHHCYLATMARPQTLLLPMRGVDFSKQRRQCPNTEDNARLDDMNTPPSNSEPASPTTLTSTPTTTNTTLTTSKPTTTRNSNLHLITIEEYLLAHPTPYKLLRRSALDLTKTQYQAYNSRLDDCHRVLFASLHRDLCAFDIFCHYKHGWIFKGRILAAVVIHVRPKAKHPWATIKRKIEGIFEGLGDSFEDGWELTSVDFKIEDRKA